MSRLHLLVGLAGVLSFLATGQYMDLALDHLRGMDDAQRLLFRSTHIYLLFASLLNLALGLYLPPSPTAWRGWLRISGSALVLIAPALALAAFCTEPWLPGLERSYSRLTAFASLAGVLSHAMAGLTRRAEPIAGAE